jgi:hypothetical protein
MLRTHPPTETPVHNEAAEFHARAATLLRSLAEREPSELPIVTACLDVRPSADATVPGVIATRIVVRRRLDELAAGVAEHGDAQDSFAADADRIREIVERETAEHQRGSLIVACDGEGLFEELRTWNALEPRVEARLQPFLVPFARLVDHEPAILALADTNTLRLFVSQPGRLVEEPAMDDEPFNYTRTEQGGWSQANYQRHVDEHAADFARAAAALIARRIDETGAERLFLAGDQVAIPRLRDELPKTAADALRDVLRLEVRTTLDEIESVVLPAIDRFEAVDARDAADRLVGAVAADGLGLAVPEASRQALVTGQGLELLVDPDGPPDDVEADELIRLAARTGTRITFVENHDGLRAMGGVGLLLRFRTRPPNA